MTIDALIQSHGSATWQRHPMLNRRLADRLVSTAATLVILCAVAPNRFAELESNCRMLRRQGFQGLIAIGYRKSKTIGSDARQQLKQAGADYVTHRLHSMNRMIAHYVERLRADETEPEESTNPSTSPHSLLADPYIIERRPATECEPV